MQEPDRIAELGRITSEKVIPLFADARDAITEKISASIDEAKEEGKDPSKLIVSVSLSVKWNLGTNKVDVELSVPVPHKFSETAEMEDHNQSKLPFSK